MHMLDEIFKQRDAIKTMAAKHGVDRLWVFGSCARREDSKDSDVDLLVRFAPNTNGTGRLDVKLEVSDLLGREVDVVSVDSALTEPRFARRILKERIVL